MNYPASCTPLPPDADDATIDRLCQEYTAALMAWLDGDGVERAAQLHYDGTVASACRLYREHPYSHYTDENEVKLSTRYTYNKSLKIIEATVGLRLIRKLTVLDVEHWYKQWRKPAVKLDKEGKKAVGRERIDRAHDAVSMFRTVLRFCSALGHIDCRRLSEELRDAKSIVSFERGVGRDQELTYAQTQAFMKKALEMGEGGVIPRERGLYMALGTAAQFELLLRQKDIIGEYLKAGAKVRARQAEPLVFGARRWSGFFVWERLPGWRWRVRTSKSRYRETMDFDLKRYPLLFPLLEAVPHAERSGPIIKGEHGLPVPEHSYRKWFRQIARAAGIPDDVWNMDSRAGGATEAFADADVSLDTVREGLSHTDTKMSLHYIRPRAREKKLASLADARSLARAKKEGSDGSRERG